MAASALEAPERAGLRTALRLPAPPPKRQKVGAAPPAPPQPAPAPAETSPVQPAVTELAEEPEAPSALPNDALVALQLLRSRFPAEARVAPFATKAQLYTLVADRTALDRQVDELRAANAVRLLQLPCGTDEFAVMLTSDYCAALRNSQAQLLQQASGGGGGAGGGADASAQPGQPAAPAAQAAQAAAAAAVFDWMERRVLPGCTQVMITHARLMELLAGGRSAGAQQHARAGAAAAGAAAAAAAGGAVAAADCVTDAHVSLLLSQGYLTRHTGGPDSYLFSMPNAGAAVRSVAAGRAEILGLLQRRRQPELLEAELAKRRLQRSVLGVRWHVTDMVGGGALLRIPTTVGPLLRAAKRGR